MVSEKQLLANQKNAIKSTGPKTEQGKAMSACNSLKHGLLAREVVITEGEGAEDQQAFDALLADLLDQFSPIGSLEEILVEKIAVCYWRLGRANRYEVGVLRRKLDTATDDYYRQEGNETDAQIDKQIAMHVAHIKAWVGDFEVFMQIYKSSKDLSEIYHCTENWKRLEDEFITPQRDDAKHLQSIRIVVYNDGLQDKVTEESLAETIRKRLNKEGYKDDDIWQMHLDLYGIEIDKSQSALEKLAKDKIKNKLRLSALKKSNALPPKVEMDNLLRYETAIERQLYKAISQLERQQRHRAGDYVPVPVQVDLNINDLKTGT